MGGVAGDVREGEVTLRVCVHVCVCVCDGVTSASMGADVSAPSLIRVQVLVDVLSRVWCQLSFDTCARVLPLLEGVLASAHERYPFRLVPHLFLYLFNILFD